MCVRRRSRPRPLKTSDREPAATERVTRHITRCQQVGITSDIGIYLKGSKFLYSACKLVFAERFPRKGSVQIRRFSGEGEASSFFYFIANGQ
jgi:hypothetical protein